MFELWAQFWTKWSTRTSSPDDFEVSNEWGHWGCQFRRLADGGHEELSDGLAELDEGVQWQNPKSSKIDHQCQSENLYIWEIDHQSENLFEKFWERAMPWGQIWCGTSPVPVISCHHLSNPLKVLTLHQILGHRSNYCFFGLAFTGSGAPNFLTSMAGPPLQSGAPKPASSRCGSRSNLERCINLYKWESSEWT